MARSLLVPVYEQNKTDGRGALVVESDAEDVSLADSTSDPQVSGQSSLSASAKKRCKAKRRAARQLASQPVVESDDLD
eukprot:1586360-Amphidinium_carterae.1